MLKFFSGYNDFLFENENSIEEIYSKFYSSIERRLFDKIVKADPFTKTSGDNITKMGNYSKWLLSLYTKKKLLIEDLYKATEYLKDFDKRKQKLPANFRDINKYNNIAELKIKLDEIGGTGKPTEDESYLINDRFYINKNDAIIFKEDNHFLIVIPKTLEASEFYAKGTEWCTQYPDNFYKYSNEGDLYILIDKNKLNTSDTNRRMQIHFPTKQFMDINDQHLKDGIIKQIVSYFKDVDGYKRLRYKLEGKSIKDLENDTVSDLKYDMVYTATSGYNIFKSNGKTGLLSEDGVVIIPSEFDYIEQIKNGLVVTMIGTFGNKKCGLWNTNGEELLKPKYSGLKILSGNLIKVEHGSFSDKNYKESVIDINDNTIIPPTYNKIVPADRYFIVEINHLKGVIDIDSKVIIPIKYGHIQHIKDDYFYASIKYLDNCDLYKYDKIILPSEYGYKHVRIIGDVFFVNSGNYISKWKALTTDLKELSNLTFDKIGDFVKKSNTAVIIDNKPFLLNLKDGKVIETTVDISNRYFEEEENG